MNLVKDKVLQAGSSNRIFKAHCRPPLFTADFPERSAGYSQARQVLGSFWAARLLSTGALLSPASVSLWATIAHTHIKENQGTESDLLRSDSSEEDKAP